MSEYQYIAFRAVDGPVSEQNLNYMRRQSTRAEITPWSFDNEYHFGGFRGDAREMLRRGYDVHLHYANFGTRRLMIRLPGGLPDMAAAKPYFVDRALWFIKDKRGRGGILEVYPDYEPGDLEDLWDLGELTDRLIGLREELIQGDLRPLYLAHLAVCSDINHDPEESTEGPVPAGLSKLTDSQRALAELYGLDKPLLAAAGQGSPALLKAADVAQSRAKWLRAQPAAAKDAWLEELMREGGATVRNKIVAQFNQNANAPSWPTAVRGRTVSELWSAAKQIERKANQQAAAKADRQRAKLLANMAADPNPYLRETEELVTIGGTDSYREAAQRLADLRDALAGTDKADLPAKQALKLKKKNPTLNRLTSELRKRGFVPK